MLQKRVLVGLLGFAVTGFSLPADADPYREDHEYLAHHRWSDWDDDPYPRYDRHYYRPYYREYYRPDYRYRESHYYRPHYRHHHDEDED